MSLCIYHHIPSPAWVSKGAQVLWLSFTGLQPLQHVVTWLEHKSCFYVGTMRAEENHILMVIIMAIMWKILLSPDPCLAVELV